MIADRRQDAHQLIKTLPGPAAPFCSGDDNRMRGISEQRLQRLPRWVGPAFVLGGVLMLPWIVYVHNTLPEDQLSPHYRTAWVGFDVILLIQMARTGFFAFSRQGRRFLPVPASATSALLVVDAWFDVTTAPTSGARLVAIMLAVCAELPLAVLCRSLAVRSARVPTGSKNADC